MENNEDKKDNKDIETKKEDIKEDIITLKKEDYTALLNKVEKIADIEKMLVAEQEEKKTLKFENIKQKHKLNDDLCELLNITADTKEEDISAKIEKFNAIKGKDGTEEEKDDAVFFKSKTTKTTNADKIAQLIKDGKVEEALALRLKS